MLSLILLGGLAFAVSLLATPMVRALARRSGLGVDHPSSRKIHKTPIPRLGGLAIMLSYAIALGALKLLSGDRGVAWPPDMRVSWLAIAAVGLMFATGLIDDIAGLKPWQKLSGQLAAALIAYGSGVQIHFIQNHPVDSWVSLPATVLWLILCCNAFNLIDGMDGLAAGIGFLATSTMFVAGIGQHNLGLSIVTLPLCGALLGFLRYNFNPASIFLGDCGSLSIGFMLGCFGVLWSNKSATLLGMTAPIMALAVPLLDASVSVARRYLRNQPIFGGDRRHVHHRLLDLGLTHRKAVLMLYGGCAFAALFSLLQNRVHDQFGGLLVVLFCGLAWVGIQYLGYIEFGTATKLILKGWLRNVVDAEVRLRLFEDQLTKAVTLTECWETIRLAAREFGFDGVRICVGATNLTDSFNPSARSWQIRVPLPDDQYINFYSSFSHERRLDLVSSFIRVVEQNLASKPFLSPASTALPRRKSVQAMAVPTAERAAIS